MNNNRILGQRAESTIKILEEFAGKNLTQDSTIVKSASTEVEDISLNDVLTSISESKKFYTNGMSKRASVINIDDSFTKSAEKTFLASAQEYLIKRCRSFGSKGVQIESGDVDLSDVSRKGLSKAVPSVKSASVEYKITNTDLGRDNYATVKVSMVDSKFVDSEFITLNDKTRYAFTSDGWTEMLKEAHKPSVPQDDESRHFIVMEYKEYPNIGIRGSYKSLGKYSNYLQLNTILKNNNCFVAYKHDTSDFGHAYEIHVDEELPLDKLASLLKENGTTTFKPENAATRLKSAQQIIPNSSLISFADPDGSLVYIKVSKVLKEVTSAYNKDVKGESYGDTTVKSAEEMLPGYESAPEAVLNEEATSPKADAETKAQYSQPGKKVFVSGTVSKDYNEAVNGLGKFAAAIFLNLSNQIFEVRNISKDDIKIASAALVSEGKNPAPTKQDGKKSIEGPGGKQKQEIGGKPAPEGSRSADGAWGQQGSASPEQGAIQLLSGGENKAPTKQDGNKELNGPGGKQKTEDPNTGGTEKFEGTGKVDEFLTRGLEKGQKAKGSAPSNKPALNDIQKKDAYSGGPAKQVKDSTPGVDINANNRKCETCGEDKEDCNCEIKSAANRSSARIKAISAKKKQIAGEEAQGAPIAQPEIPGIAPTNPLAGAGAGQALSQDSSPSPKNANSLNKGTNVDDARDISDKEQTTVISIFDSFKTLDEGTNRMNELMGSDIKTYVRSDVAKLIRNILRGGYKLEKKDGTSLGINYDISDNSEPMKIVGVDRQKDVPENVNEKKKVAQVATPITSNTGVKVLPPPVTDPSKNNATTSSVSDAELATETSKLKSQGITNLNISKDPAKPGFNNISYQE